MASTTEEVGSERKGKEKGKRTEAVAAVATLRSPPRRMACSSKLGVKDPGGLGAERDLRRSGRGRVARPLGFVSVEEGEEGPEDDGDV